MNKDKKEKKVICDVHYGYQAELEYKKKGSDSTSILVIFTDAKNIGVANQELILAAMKANVSAEDVLSININKFDVYFLFIENKFFMRPLMYENIIKKWKYMEGLKKSNDDYEYVVRTDQPDWMLEFTGLHEKKYYVTEDLSIQWKVGYLLDNGQWIAINTLTGQVEFCESLKVMDLVSAINALAKFGVMTR